MKYRICLTVFFVLFTLNYVHAQQEPAEGSVAYGKGKIMAAVIELPYAPAVVEKGIKEYFSSRGVKAGKSKGFNIFRGVTMQEGSAELNDLHFKVERKSRKEKNASRVYLLAGRPGENMGLRTAEDRHKLDAAKAFLTQLAPSVALFNLDQEIAQQQEVVNKAEKRLKALQDDQKKLEDKLTANKQDQQRQVDEISKQKAVLEAIIAKKKAS